jgi:hypothetical protein
MLGRHWQPNAKGLPPGCRIWHRQTNHKKNLGKTKRPMSGHWVDNAKTATLSPFAGRSPLPFYRELTAVL